MTKPGAHQSAVQSIRFFLGTVPQVPIAVMGNSPPVDCSICAEINLTSDYRFYGSSSSDGEYAVQGSLYLQDASGRCGGVLANTVDFNDTSTRFEFDTFIGFVKVIGELEYNAELVYISYDGNKVGPTYDFWQGKLATRRYFNNFWLTASVACTPQWASASGNQTELLLEGNYTVAHGYRLTGGLGRGVLSSDPGLWYWNLGVEKDWQSWTFALSWAGTDLSKAECGGTDLCEEAVIGAVTLRFY